MAILRLALAFAGFISIGLPDALLGVAWPYARTTFNQSLDAGGLLVLGATVGYSVSALCAGRLLHWVGLGGLLVISALMTAVGIGIYLVAPNFTLLWAVVTLAAVGGGAIDVGLNSYAMEYHSPAVMQWLHASFGVGVTVGPALMVMAIASPEGWPLGYRWVTAGLLALALVFALSIRIWPAVNTGQGETAPDSIPQALREPKIWGVLGMFSLYVGLEVAVGVWSFSVMTHREVSAVTAGLWVSCYWGAFTVSRIIAGSLGDRLSHWQWLRISIGLAIVGALLWSWGQGALAAVPVALMGLAMGPMYPAMMSGTQQRVGRRLQAAAVPLQVGPPVLAAGVIAWAFGSIGEAYGLDWIPVMALGVLMLMAWIERRLYRASQAL